MVNNEFANKVVEAMSNSSEHQFEWSNVTKNNGVVLTGVRRTDVEAGIPVTTLYLEGFETQYEDGRNFNEIIDELLSVYNRAESSGPIIDVSEVTCFSRIKDKIKGKLINADKNPGIPCVQYGDQLVMSFYIDLDSMNPQKGGKNTIQITEDLLRNWDVSIKDVYEAAMKNIDFSDCSIMDMLDVLREMMPWVPDEEIDMAKRQQRENGIPPQYIMTTNDRMFGATLLANTDNLNKFCIENNIQGLYVIPSSIHECIFMERSYHMTEEEIETMIKDINDQVVDPSEVLTDSLFIYDFEENKLTNAKTGVEVAPAFMA